MSERKHSLRPPEAYLDLAYNPHQPRDSHGRWAKTPGTVVASEAKKFTEAAHNALVVPQPKSQTKKAKAMREAAAEETRKIADHAMHKVAKKEEAKEVVSGAKKVLLTKKGDFKDTPAARRHFRKITHEAQMELFHECGLHLNPKFKDQDTTDLMKAWSQPGHSFKEQQEMREEIERRLKQLDIVAKSMDQSMTDFVRENRRDSLRKFDQRLHGIPGGKAIIAFRERLTTDHVLDHMEGINEKFQEHGKAYAKHVLTAVAIASLLHPLGIVAVGGAAGAGLLPDGATEAFSTLLENMWVHSGLAVALDVPLLKFLDPIFKPFEREHRAKSAKKFAAKHQTRRLHV